MPDCECLEKCIFFNDKMAKMDAVAENTKQRYCRDKFEQCARYIVFKAMGRENVPTDLYPMQQSIAKRIVNSQATG